jgi:hypothetical protein
LSAVSAVYHFDDMQGSPVSRGGRSYTTHGATNPLYQRLKNDKASRGWLYVLILLTNRTARILLQAGDYGKNQ